MTIVLPKLEFEKTQGGLSRPLANEDHISAMIFIQADTPSGFTDPAHKILDISQAESLGIAQGSLETCVMHYHISEFFRINPGAELWVAQYATLDGEAQILEVQSYAGGKVRQLGIWTADVLTTGMVEDLQAVGVTMAAEHTPLCIILCPNLAAVADLTALPDLRDLDESNELVSVIIGQDGGNDGKAIFEDALLLNSLKSLGILGAVMGAISKAAVHESIAWVAKFNMSQLTSEYDVPAISNGDLYKDLSSAEVTELNAKGYIFLLKHVGIGGSYINDSNNCALITSDYNHIELVRTIDKAIRNIRTYMLPELNRPVYVDPISGKLTADMVMYLEDKAGQALIEMERAGELSGYQVTINPEQDIITSSELEIVVAKVPVGVARAIKIKIGYVTKLS